MTIAEAKQRLTIPEIWTRLELPGTPAKSCRAPWREDRTASFSVSQDGKLWNDFATGEGGDAVAFLQKAKGLDTKEACREYLRLAGNRGESPIKLVTQNHPSKRPVYRPQLRRGTTEEIEALSRLRCISPQGLDAAQQAGILALSNLKGHTAWDHYR
jgi:DNA primase